MNICDGNLHKHTILWKQKIIFFIHSTIPEGNTAQTKKIDEIFSLELYHSINNVMFATGQHSFTFDARMYL